MNGPKDGTAADSGGVAAAETPAGADPMMAVINEKLDLLLKAQGIAYARGEVHEGQ